MQCIRRLSKVSQVHSSRKFSKSSSDTFDVVVVGGGLVGSALAAALGKHMSEDSCRCLQGSASTNCRDSTGHASAQTACPLSSCRLRFPCLHFNDSLAIFRKVRNSDNHADSNQQTTHLNVAVLDRQVTIYITALLYLPRQLQI